MKFANLKSNDVDAILRLFNLGEKVPIFCTSSLDIPLNYCGYFIYISKYTSGKISSIQVEKHTGDTSCPKLHNTNGPAHISFNSFGCINTVKYYIEDRLHNPFGPACIRYENGKKVKEEYFIKGKRHNSTGPAIHEIYNRRSINKYFLWNKSIDAERFINSLEVKINNK